MRILQTKNSPRVEVHVISPRVNQFTEAENVYIGNIQAQCQDFMKSSDKSARFRGKKTDPSISRMAPLT